jgi:hypothetical protein
MAWPVDLSSDAFLDLEAVKSRGDRKAIANAGSCDHRCEGEVEDD